MKEGVSKKQHMWINQPLKRMEVNRWEEILKRREFAGICLRDELIRARKADLAYIAELEGQDAG
ncbi:hypothetical protein N9937_01175 [bacterium]|nr:hypothetical protein [bacterium]